MFPVSREPTRFLLNEETENKGEAWGGGWFWVWGEVERDPEAPPEEEEGETRTPNSEVGAPNLFTLE